MNSQLPFPHGYLCEVRAEGFVYGTGRRVVSVLDTFSTLSPVLALRWLRSWTLRLASRLDPDLEVVEWAPAEAFREQTSDRDPAGELTYWASVFVPLREAQWHLREGNPLTAIVEDPASQCLYVLSATPTRSTPDLPLYVPPSWSPEPCSRRYGSPPPDDQNGPDRRGRHRRARLFV